MQPTDPVFEEQDRIRVHDGFLKLDLHDVRQTLFRGGVTPVIRREVVVAPEAVAAICYDPEQEAVVLVEQARLPAKLAGFDAIQTEIVAGLTEPGELPEMVVRREVKEETGLDIVGAPLPITRILTTPGHSTESVHLYCVRVDAGLATGHHGVAAEHEDIRVLVLSLDELAARIADGRIANSFTIIAGLWLAANRTRVHIAWGLTAHD